MQTGKQMREKKPSNDKEDFNDIFPITASRAQVLNDSFGSNEINGHLIQSNEV